MSWFHPHKQTINQTKHTSYHNFPHLLPLDHGINKWTSNTNLLDRKHDTRIRLKIHMTIAEQMIFFTRKILIPILHVWTQSYHNAYTSFLSTPNLNLNNKMPHCTSSLSPYSKWHTFFNTNMYIYIHASSNLIWHSIIHISSLPFKQYIIHTQCTSVSHRFLPKIKTNQGLPGVTLHYYIQSIAVFSCCNTYNMNHLPSMSLNDSVCWL